MAIDENSTTSYKDIYVLGALHLVFYHQMRMDDCFVMHWKQSARCDPQDLQYYKCKPCFPIYHCFCTVDFSKGGESRL